MSAAKGNNYWSFRDKHGRGFKYTPELFWDEAIKYFEYISASVWNKKEPIKSGDNAGTCMEVKKERVPSILGFCAYCGIDTDTFRNYISNEENYKDFFEVTTRIRSVIESNQFEGATVGAYNPNIIARKLGLIDKTDITSDGGKVSSIPVVLSDGRTLNDLRDDLKPE